MNSIATTPLDAALAYAARGLHVFPLAPRSKQPFKGTDGQHAATTDPDRIRAWWTQCPDANVGIALAPSNLVALDIDAYHDDDEKLAALQLEHGELPCTPASYSGSGQGLHFFFKSPGFPIRGSVGGIVTRGNNYVVAPPSVHPSGGVYRWADGASILDVPPAELPPVWREALRRRAVVGDVGIPDEDDEPDWLRAVPHDKRVADMREHLECEDGEVKGESPSGHTWAIASTVCRVYGVRDPDAILEAMLEYNERCDPPYREPQIARFVANAFSRGGKPWGDHYDPRRIADAIEESVLDDGLAEFRRVLQRLPRVQRRGGAHATKSPAGEEPSEATDATVDETADEPAAVLDDEIVADLEVVRDSRSPRYKRDAAYLRKLLPRARDKRDGADFGISSEEELDRAAIAVVRHAPRSATDDQLIKVMLASAGRFAPRLREAVRVARERLRDDRATHKAVPQVDDEVTADSDFELYKTGPQVGSIVPNSERNHRIALKKLGIEFKYNELSYEEEIVVDNSEPVVLEDIHVKQIRNAIERSFGFIPAKDMFNDNCEVFAHQNKYHPVCEYLDAVDAAHEAVDEKLPEEWLIRFAGAEDTEYVRAVSRLILVAAVRRVRRVHEGYADGCKFDECLVLETPTQGKNKSSAIQILAVKARWFTNNFNLTWDAKQILEMTSGAWIIEIGEMAGGSRADRNEVKQALSRQDDRARLAYARRASRRPRQFVMIGTKNDLYYLTDPTGDRRYWPVRVLEFDLAALRANVDALWAAASRLERENPEDSYIRLDPSLYGAAAAEQSKRRVRSAVELKLEDFFDDAQGWVSPEDVWKVAGYLDDRLPKRHEQAEIVDAMTALGWRQVERCALDNVRKRWFTRGDKKRRIMVRQDHLGKCTLIEPCEPRGGLELKQSAPGSRPGVFKSEPAN